MLELVFYKICALVISVGFLGVAWLSKRLVGYWLNPGSIFSLFWLLYSLLPLVSAPTAAINPLSVLYILVFALCFCSSTYIFNWKPAFAVNSLKPPAHTCFNTPLFRLFFRLIAVLAAVALFYGVLEQGFSITQLVSDPIMVAGQYAKKRYADEIVVSPVAQIGLLLSYLAVLFGGLLYGSLWPKQSRLMVLGLAFVPSLLVMTLQSAKGLFFLSVFIFLGAVLVTKIYDKKYDLINFKTIKTAAICGVVVFPLVIMSFLSRGLAGSDTAYIVFKLKRYLVTYSSGHLYAFSDWFSDRYFNDSVLEYNQEQVTVGFYSLMSIFRALGDERPLPLGVYAEYYVSGDYIVTNLYTVFRGLIVDYTILGSLIVAVVSGFLANWVFYRLLYSKMNAAYVVLFSFYVAVVYQTYIISTFMWKTIPVVILLSIVALALYFYVLRLRRSSYRGRSKSPEEVR